MKALCKVSHEVPGATPGSFRSYVAGRVYDIGVPAGPYFEVLPARVPAAPKSGTKETTPSAGAGRRLSGTTKTATKNKEVTTDADN